MPRYEVMWIKSGTLVLEAGSKEEAKRIFTEDQEVYTHESDVTLVVESVVESRE